MRWPTFRCFVPARICQIMGIAIVRRTGREATINVRHFFSYFAQIFSNLGHEFPELLSVRVYFAAPFIFDLDFSLFGSTQRYVSNDQST